MEKAFIELFLIIRELARNMDDEMDDEIALMSFSLERVESFILEHYFCIMLRSIFDKKGFLSQNRNIDVLLGSERCLCW